MEIKKQNIAVISASFLIYALYLILSFYKFNIDYSWLYLPVRFGIIKDFFDVLIVSIIPWNGWVVLIPMIVSVWVKSSNNVLLSIYISTSIFVGVFASFFNYSDSDFAIILKGILVYILIYFPFYLVSLSVNTLNHRKGRKICL